MTEFVEYLAEVFEPFGEIRAKRMFGGYGVYHDDLIFGLVDDDVLYLKADAASAPAFVERGLKPFQYAKQGKLTRISYYLAPEEIFDDADEARAWATLAFEAALRSRKK
jgi:DNA transformation protein